MTVYDDKVILSRTAEQPNSHSAVLVSIIIPAYNTSEYIHRAIESSLRQTHSDVEVLVVDDGSKDNTLEVAQSYAEKDSRVRVFHKENGGVSSARNFGMREANGEYYVFLDSDDWFEDDAVEVLLDAQMKYPDKLIAANFYLVSVDGSKQPLDNKNVKTRSLSIEEVVESYAGIHKEDSIGVDLGYMYAKIFRADICSKGVTFRENITLCEDRVFIFEYISLIRGVFYVNKPIFNYLKRPNSAARAEDSERISGGLQSLLKVYEIMSNHPKNTPELKNLMGISGCRVIVDSMINSKIFNADREAAREYLKQYERDYLTCRQLSLKSKISFLYKMHLPLPVSRAIFHTWQFIKRIRDKMRRN